MEVKSNGKIVGTFIGFTNNMDFVLVSTKNGIKKFKASERSIVCDMERRHECKLVQVSASWCKLVQVSLQTRSIMLV